MADPDQIPDPPPLEPTYTYIPNQGYAADASAPLPTTAVKPSTTVLDDDEPSDYDDILDSETEDAYAPETLGSGNPNDYTKSYNRQRKLNDPSVPLSQRPKTNTQSRVDDQISSLSKHAAKIRLDDLGGAGGTGGGGRTEKDKSDRATSEKVLDKRTRMILLQMLNRNVISSIYGCISTGKEANVYHATTTPDDSEETLHRAVKVYKTAILDFKDRERYMAGEFRFRGGYRKGDARQMVKLWAEKEFRNLRRLYNAGVPCPEPLYLRLHVLVMSLLGDRKGRAAPRLKDVVFEGEDADATSNRWNKMYKELVGYIRVMYQTCHLVHADLSEYNLLYHASKIHVIDVSQSVEHDHPRSLEFLRMDIKNITAFFRNRGVNTMSERTIFDFVTDVSAPTSSPEMEAKLGELYERRANLPDEESKPEDETDAEVFRQQYIPQTLDQVYDYERDAEKIERGEGNDLVYQNLLAPKTADAPITPLSEDGGVKLSASADGSGTPDGSGGSEDEEGEGDDEWEERENGLPRGKRFVDREDKKAHKAAVKEEKREKRKEKMPKHIKKKLISQSNKGGKKK